MEEWQPLIQELQSSRKARKRTGENSEIDGTQDQDKATNILMEKRQQYCSNLTAPFSARKGILPIVTYYASVSS